MYGAACNQSDFVLQAIQDAKLDLKVWLGVYIVSSSLSYFVAYELKLIKIMSTGTGCSRKYRANGIDDCHSQIIRNEARLGCNRWKRVYSQRSQ
jgi:hypothetical protein